MDAKKRESEKSISVHSRSLAVGSKDDESLMDVKKCEPPSDDRSTGGTRLLTDRRRAKAAQTAHAIGHLLVHVAVTVLVIMIWTDAMSGMGEWYEWPLLAGGLTLLTVSYFCLGLMMHEGSHGHLSPNRTLNEILFQVAGGLLQTVPSLYRELHWRHHTSPNEEEDLELIPETDGALSEVQRRRALWRLVILGGLERNRIQEKFLWNHRAGLRKKTLRRAWREWIVLKIVLIGGSGAWIVGLGFSSWAICYACPAFLGGWLLVWLQLIEHFGMARGRVVAATRDVQARGAIQRFLYWTMFHINYHTLHHDDASIPGHALPEANARWTQRLIASNNPSPEPFPSYLAALQHMLPALRSEIEARRVARSA